MPNIGLPLGVRPSVYTIRRATYLLVKGFSRVFGPLKPTARVDLQVEPWPHHCCAVGSTVDPQGFHYKAG